MAVDGKTLRNVLSAFIFVLCARKYQLSIKDLIRMNNVTHMLWIVGYYL